MFTLYRHPDAPDMSIISGNPNDNGESGPKVELLPIGHILEEEISKTVEMRKEVSIPKFVIMPDHVHLLLTLKENIDFSVTKIVSQIESATTSRSRRAGLIAWDESVFKATGLNDRIAFEDRLELLSKYIDDNPRRLLIKRLHPDLFRRNLSVNIGGDKVDCIGNIFLLRKPLQIVHVRRKWSSDEQQEYKRNCIAVARQGAVLISPFIHPIENEIRKQVLDEGGSIIQIVEHGFEERFKPTGRMMDVCAEGRLLLISEAGASTRSEDMTYAKASRLNQLAERIAATSPSTPLKLNK